jgi:hypothetical protein
LWFFFWELIIILCAIFGLCRARTCRRSFVDNVHSYCMDL